MKKPEKGQNFAKRAEFYTISQNPTAARYCQCFFAVIGKIWNIFLQHPKIKGKWLKSKTIVRKFGTGSILLMSCRQKGTYDF